MRYDGLLASKRRTNWSTNLDMDEMATSNVKTNKRTNLERRGEKGKGRDKKEIKGKQS